MDPSTTFVPQKPPEGCFHLFCVSRKPLPVKSHFWKHQHQEPGGFLTESPHKCRETRKLRLYFQRWKVLGFDIQMWQVTLAGLKAAPDDTGTLLPGKLRQLRAAEHGWRGGDERTGAGTVENSPQLRKHQALVNTGALDRSQALTCCFSAIEAPAAAFMSNIWLNAGRKQSGWIPQQMGITVAGIWGKTRAAVASCEVHPGSEALTRLSS